MANIKQVAELADVSVATVSRVINNSGFVSPVLRQRVLDAMHELSYQVNGPARSLRRQETRTVGVLVPQLDHPFFSALSFAIEQALSAENYYVFMCSAEESSKKEEDYTRMMLRQRVDGVIIGPTSYNQANLMKLLDQRIPVVLVDRDLPELEVNRVIINNVQGGYDGARHLLDLGHRHIGVIGAHERSGAMDQRVRGILQVFAERAHDGRPRFVFTHRLQQFEEGYLAARQLLRQAPRPTAIYALNDVLAIGVLKAAAELDLRTPEDLSVMGFDDIALASYVVPALTTVAQPIYDMGETAAQILLRQMNGPDQPIETVRFDTQLIIRSSTAPVPSD
jgi:LacI family transcriptional regulator